MGTQKPYESGNQPPFRNGLRDPRIDLLPCGLDCSVKGSGKGFVSRTSTSVSGSTQPKEELRIPTDKW